MEVCLANENDVAERGLHVHTGADTAPDIAISEDGVASAYRCHHLPRVFSLIALLSGLVCSVPVRASEETPDGVTTNAQVNDANAPHLGMIVRDSYLPGVPILVRVALAGPNDVVNRDVWDANAVLSVSGNSAVKLSPDVLSLYNGLGSALVTFTGKGDFALTARVNGLEKTVTLVDWTNQPVHAASGTLKQAQTWSGVYHITGDLTIPAGITLTLNPGTLVLLDGVSSGTNGTNIDVQGSVQSLGTAASPVTVTAYASGRNWGQMYFAGAKPSVFSYTEITRAGRSPGTGHTGTGPAIRASNSTLTFDHASLADNAGKIMETDSGTALTFTSTLFTRSRSWGRRSRARRWYSRTAGSSTCATRTTPTASTFTIRAPTGRARSPTA